MVLNGKGGVVKLKHGKQELWMNSYFKGQGGNQGKKKHSTL